MVRLKKWVWAAAAVAAAATAAPAAAQQGGVTSGGARPTGTLGNTGGLTQTTVGGLGGAGGSRTIGPTGGLSGGAPGSVGGGGAQGGLGGGSDLGGTQLLQMQRAPQLTPPTGAARGSLSSANFLAGYYADPRFQGLINAQVNAVPGGFGLPLYQVTGGGVGAGGALNRAGALGGGLAGGGFGRQGGLGGLGQTGTESGIVVPLPVQIAYTAEIRFPTTPVAPAAIQADLRGVLDRAPAIASPQNLQVVVGAGNNVTLRGTVRDEDEARLVEGLVRLTPGVGEIKNELAVIPAGK